MQSINSVYKYNNIVFKEYPYVSPIEYPFSILNKNVIVHYNPIIDLLSTFFSNINIDILCNNSNNQFQKYTDVRDGTKWKEFPVNTIRLQIYIDEFEICNPLGSKTKLKISAMYFTLLN